MTGIRLAVVGAHLRGQPLHHQLADKGAIFGGEARTAPCYRLFLLEKTSPPKPGLVRAEQGAPIELEIWELPPAEFGDFVSRVPPPLTIGSVELESGDWVKGFLCEEIAVRNAREITRFGGWRAFLAGEARSAG